MANIGVGETFDAWLVKSEDIAVVDSMIKSTETLNAIKSEYTKHFKYRHLSQSEMTYAPISGYLKGKFDKVIFTSETDISPKERDKILFKDGTFLRVTRSLPQKQLGMYMFSKKFPHILELE
jgi:hypothetical protein